MSFRLMATFTAFVFFLVSCSPAGSSLPEPTVTHSPPPPPTELPILELMITPDEKGTHHAPVVAEPTPQLTVQPVLPPTPTPAPRLRQLTDGGCCTESFWSPDGQRILYIDRPSMDAQSGLWGVDLHGGQPEFVTDQLGIYSPDMQLRAFLVNGQTIVERLDTGEQWRIPKGLVSPRMGPGWHGLPVSPVLHLIVLSGRYGSVDSMAARSVKYSMQ